MQASVNLVNQLNLSIAKRLKFFVCKNSRMNIILLNLLMQYGLILNFYKMNFLEKKICVFLKYVKKKPFIKKINMVVNNNILDNLKVKGDVLSNVFYVVSTNKGTLSLVSNNNFRNTNWYSKKGGKVLFKVFV